MACFYLRSIEWSRKKETEDLDLRGRFEELDINDCFSYFNIINNLIIRDF